MVFSFETVLRDDTIIPWLVVVTTMVILSVAKEYAIAMVTRTLGMV